MLIILQRYNFWSNSQPEKGKKYFVIRCWLYCKDTTFEAIHNTVAGRSSADWDVDYIAKIQLLKQFTTGELTPVTTTWCWLYCKDTTFEAIHNEVYTTLKSTLMLIILQRYNFWSNSQLMNAGDVTIQDVDYIAKIQLLKQFTTSKRNLHTIA